MARIWRAVAVVVVGLALVACADDEAVDLTTLTDAVYRVSLETCAADVVRVATAVAVDEYLLATVAHTFDNASAIEVTVNGVSQNNLDLVWLDRERDLALIRLREPAATVLPLGTATDQIEATIITIEEDGPRLTTADIRQRLNITLDGEGERAGLELAADIEAGDSGAPVMDDGGHVIGMIFGSNRTEATGWAVASKEIEAALAQQEGGLVSLACDDD